MIYNLIEIVGRIKYVRICASFPFSVVSVSITKSMDTQQGAKFSILAQLLQPTTTPAALV